jgi:hypothetical protein
LLLVQGPLALDWTHRKRRLLPKLENGDLMVGRPPTVDRFRLWVKANVRVHGQKDWCFVKLHTHGAQESNATMLLGETTRRFHHDLAQLAPSARFNYYYVTAREMAQLAHQAEEGASVPDWSRLQTSLPTLRSG